MARYPVTDRDWDDAHLINAALDIHHDDPAFGYRFIADELARQGITASENRVARLCSQERIWSVFAKKRGLSRKPGPPVHDDLVDRRFIAARPGQRRSRRRATRESLTAWVTAALICWLSSSGSFRLASRERRSSSLMVRRRTSSVFSARRSASPAERGSRP